LIDISESCNRPDDMLTFLGLYFKNMFTETEKVLETI